MINTGYIEMTAESGTIVVRIYYDATIAPTSPQPLINGPRGYCLDLTNTSGKSQRLQFTLPDTTIRTVTVGQGDPVANRSLTAAELNGLGYVYRTDVNGFSIE